jgi:uncharacterized protein (DUF2235 family)
MRITGTSIQKQNVNRGYEMADRIVILSDGTGNAASSVWRTNVWRIFQSLVLEGDEQAAKYDDGVGTSSFLPLAILGGVFGWGLKRNILDAYKFVCRNYEDNTKLYLFGFSRGAFTVRVLTAFMLEQGLVEADSESELDALARKAYRAYRANGYHSIGRIEVPFRALRDVFVRLRDALTGGKAYDPTKNTKISKIEFVGVWDTVAAYGLPVDEMTRGVSNWIWPLELPNRVLSDDVNFARHAICLDDERTTFHPVLWTEMSTGTQTAGGADTDSGTIPTSTEKERLVQVWFAGMHSNVGGGYPDDALAFVPLYWMLNEAKKHGLTFKSEPECDPDTTKWVKAAQDKDGRLYDSRAGLGGYYRYGPRKMADLCDDRWEGVKITLPKIHESVFGRIDSGSNAYAPIGLVERYATVTSDGHIVPPHSNSFETPAQAKARVAAQERVWNYVWLRRLAYFATLAATFHIVAFWMFHERVIEHEFDNPIRIVSETVRLVEAFLPRSVVHWWTDYYAANPEWFVGGIAILVVLLSIGSSLEGRIKDAMRLVWNSRGSISPVPKNPVHNTILSIRNNEAYKWVIRFGRMQLLPAFFALAFVWIGFSATSHLIFNLADSAGAFCTGSSSTRPVDLGISQPSSRTFTTNEICFPTGLSVKRGFRYEILIEKGSPWADADAPSTPNGYLISSRSFWSQLPLMAGWGLKRVLFRPYFRLLARVGERGTSETFLDPRLVPGAPTETYRATFVAERSGEVFLYVNDAVLGLPWLNDLFYGNNKGTAKISMNVL